MRTTRSIFAVPCHFPRSHYQKHNLGTHEGAKSGEIHRSESNIVHPFCMKASMRQKSKRICPRSWKKQCEVPNTSVCSRPYAGSGYLIPPFFFIYIPFACRQLLFSFRGGSIMQCTRIFLHHSLTMQQLHETTAPASIPAISISPCNLPHSLHASSQR